MTLPLLGVRVLDLTRVVAGPVATMMLGDLGADILKVERPHSGDESRGWGPPFDDRGESAYFLACNRNKFSLAADLDDPADVRLIGELAGGADVVMDNYRPGSLERRGLDPARLLEANPRLLWCTITGFGPGSARPGYDSVVQAEAGWMAITGETDGTPMKVGVALADVITAKDAAITVLAALAGSRAARPVERRLYVSLRHSAVSALINVAQNVLVSGHDARRWGNAHPNLVPYGLFRASDREFVIAVGNDAQFAALCRALGLESLAGTRYSTNANRVEQRDDVVRTIGEQVARRPAAFWITALDAAGIPCGVVRSVAEALSDVDGSPLSGIAPFPPGEVRRPPPRLDEHGASIRARGWDALAGVGR